MRVDGRSMVPTLREGDWVLVAPSRAVRPGDIAVLDYGEAKVVHRVISRRPYRETGDGVWSPRAFLPEQVVGTVVAVSRHGRTIDLTRPLSRLGGRAIGLGGQGRMAAAGLKRMLARGAS